MRVSRKHIAFFLGLLFIGSTSAQSRDTLRVLFVGNSYTYFWNLSQTVEALASTQGIPLVARNSTAGSASWKDHWEGRKALKSREMIKENRWDVVVLQNHSMSSIDSLDDFYEYGNRFIKLVKSSGAIPVLYETWAREFNPLMQDQVSAAYNNLAKEHDIQKVPVGTIWARARELRPKLTLYDPDGSHPSPTGTYLTACVFYSFLNNEKSSGLPERVITTDRNGELLYLSIQDINDAYFIHNVVDKYLNAKLDTDD